MLEFVHNPIFVQGLGFLAAAVGISSYLLISDKWLKYGMGLSTGILSMHLYLLGATAGAAIMSIAAVRYFFAARTQDKRIGMFFIGIHICIGYFYYRSMIDLLPIAASINAAFALFFLRGIPMRLTLLISAFLWLTYNGLVGSYGGALLESFYIIANLLTLTRMTFKQQKEPK